ncbi:MAG: hypothetical protein GXY47_02150 [Acidobacteria bacterium]|nr:hypothetical protein [Acidobacteriota bacterium]
MRKFLRVAACLWPLLAAAACGTRTGPPAADEVPAGDAAGGFRVKVACDRECLAGFMTRYLKALVAHEPSRLPLTPGAKYTENGIRLNIGQGLWRTASAMPTYRVDVIDEEAGAVALLGNINENGNRNFLATRLKIEAGGWISEIESIVVRNDSMVVPVAAGARYVTHTEPHPRMMEPVPADGRRSRAELVAVGNSYFTGLDTDNHGGNVPFHPDCQRRENGIITSNNPDFPAGSMQALGCREQFDTGFSVITTDIRERRFEAVDPVTGLAMAFGFFDHDGSVARYSRTPDREMVDVRPMLRQPYSSMIAEIFKIEEGRIRRIEALLTTVPYGMESGW